MHQTTRRKPVSRMPMCSLLGTGIAAALVVILVIVRPF